MKTNKFMILGTSLLTVSLLGSCDLNKKEEKTLTELVVEPTTTSYMVGTEFNTTCLNVTAKYSDGSIKTLDEGYTVSPTLPYTFVEGDVSSGKDFTVTYEDKSKTIHVNVKEEVEVITTFELKDLFGDPNDPVWAYQSGEVTLKPNKKYMMKVNMTDHPQMCLTFYKSDDVYMEELDFSLYTDISSFITYVNNQKVENAGFYYDDEDEEYNYILFLHNKTGADTCFDGPTEITFKTKSDISETKVIFNFVTPL